MNLGIALQGRENATLHSMYAMERAGSEAWVRDKAGLLSALV